MFSDMKYIIYQEAVWIFPNFIDHSAVAIRNRFDKDDIQGAGFIIYNDGICVCYGESISLGIKSREKLDAKIVKKLLHNDK